TVHPESKRRTGISVRCFEAGKPKVDELQRSQWCGGAVNRRGNAIWIEGDGWRRARKGGWGLAEGCGSRGVKRGQLFQTHRRVELDGRRIGDLVVLVPEAADGGGVQGIAVVDVRNGCRGADFYVMPPLSACRDAR